MAQRREVWQLQTPPSARQPFARNLLQCNHGHVWCPLYGGVLISGVSLHANTSLGTTISVLNMEVSWFQRSRLARFHCAHITAVQTRTTVSGRCFNQLIRLGCEHTVHVICYFLIIILILHIVQQPQSATVPQYAIMRRKRGEFITTTGRTWPLFKPLESIPALSAHPHCVHQPLVVHESLSNEIIDNYLWL